MSNVFAGFGDWVEIFRGGKQMDSSGRVHDGNRLIERAVAGFNATEHEPPLVVGHPADNHPAFGWVEGLRRVVKDGAQVLEARFKQVAPELEEMVRKGFYKKRSAAFYADGRLRHVGLLGAAPPAVKGLADLSFLESAVATFEFTGTGRGSGQENKGEKTMMFTEQDLKAAEEKARTETEQKLKAEIEQNLKAAGEKARTETEQKLKAEIAEKEAAWAREKREAELSALVDKKVQEGKIPPALADSVLKKFLIAIDQCPEIRIASDGQVIQVRPLEYFWSFLDKAGELGLFKEIASKDRVFDGIAKTNTDNELGDAIAARVA